MIYSIFLRVIFRGARPRVRTLCKIALIIFGVGFEYLALLNTAKVVLRSNS
jgi:hypothetical protein